MLATVCTNPRIRVNVQERLEEVLVVLDELAALRPEERAGAKDHEAHAFHLLLDALGAMGPKVFRRDEGEPGTLRVIVERDPFQEMTTF